MTTRPDSGATAEPLGDELYGRSARTQPAFGPDSAGRAAGRPGECRGTTAMPPPYSVKGSSMARAMSHWRRRVDGTSRLSGTQCLGPPAASTRRPTRIGRSGPRPGTAWSAGIATRMRTTAAESNEAAPGNRGGQTDRTGRGAPKPGADAVVLGAQPKRHSFLLQASRALDYNRRLMVR